MAKHAQSVHEAQARWEGGLTDGSGRITGSSSGQLAEVPMTWNARTGGDDSLTSPEELLAAAHAACFSMALAYELQGRNAAPRSTASPNGRWRPAGHLLRPSAVASALPRRMVDSESRADNPVRREYSAS